MTYCSAIETLWSCTKQRFKKRLQFTEEKVDYAMMRTFVMEALTSIPLASVHRICHHNRHYIRQLLQETTELNN